MNAPISQKAADLIEAIKDCKGQFIRCRYRTNVKPAAAFKSVTITKEVEGVFRTGIDYAQLNSVKSAIANEERGEVQSLSWGEWAVFPWIIAHKGAEYLRLYPVESVVPTVGYTFNDGHGSTVSATKEAIAQYLTPAAKAELLSAEPRDKIACITKKLEDVELVGCWHSEVSDDVIAAEEARQ